MLAPLLFFAFTPPATEFAVYGLASEWFVPVPAITEGIRGLAPLWWTASSPPIVEVTQRGCPTCTLVRVFTGGIETDRFKRTRAGISVVPYCPACYTFPPEA